jgi:ubiquinone biosynthesis protein
METSVLWIAVPLGIVIGAVALVAVTWLLANVMRRVLGVPVGWPRSIIVALGVSLATGGLVYLAVDQFFTDESGRHVSPGPAIILGGIALLWMLGLGAAVLTVLELIIPTGALPNPATWLMGTRDRRERNRRYRHVVAIFFRHGLTSSIPGLSRRSGHRRPDGDEPGAASGDDRTDRTDRTDRAAVRRAARNFREALEESGTTFVKLGQNLSTRDTLLPKEFTAELGRLTTGAAPEPWENIRTAMTESLGADPDDVFAWVDHEPMAAASVAQVHRARLDDGTKVVLKVQRPGTREEVTRDTDIVTRLCRWLERSTDWGRDMGISRIAAAFTDALTEELDYTVEAANMREITAAMHDTQLVMPRVYDEYSSTRLLVMDELEGTPLGDAADEIAALTDTQRRQLGDMLMTSVMRQMMQYGVFQADPHQGNILLMRDQEWREEWSRTVGPVEVSGGTGEQRPVGLGMLDFGAVGHLDAADRQQLATVFAAIEHGDARILTDALLSLMDRPEDLDERSLQRSVGAMLSRYRGGFAKGEGMALFSGLMSMMNSYRLGVPEAVAAALRCLGEVEGTLRLIEPDYPIVETARKEGSALVKDQFKPKNMKDAAEGILLESLPAVRDLPRQVSGIVGDLKDGRLSVSMRMFRNPSDRAFLTNLLQQFTVAIVAGFCVLGGVVLIAFGTAGPVLTGDLTWHAAMGYVVLFAGFLMSLRTVAMVLFQRRR